MFDKYKAKKELCKAFNFYRKKKTSYLRTNTINIYQQLAEIEYAIAYVLCEYFDFKCDNPFSDKWYITYDYTYLYNECKEAYEKITKHNNITEYNYTTGCLYMYDGKNFIKMC